MLRRTSPLTVVRVAGAVAILLLYVAGAAWLVFGPAPSQETDAVGARVRAAEDLIVGPDDERIERAVERLLPGINDEGVSNILLFVPLPILAALITPRWWWLSVPGGVAASVGIEAVQQRYLDHRSPSWRDVGWNSLGVAAGATVVVVALVAINVGRAVVRPDPSAAER